MLKATVFTGHTAVVKDPIIFLAHVHSHILRWIQGSFDMPIIHIVCFDDLARTQFWSTVIIIMNIFSSCRHAGLTERFELFMCGREIGNAFSELTDPIDQVQICLFS